VKIGARILKTGVAVTITMYLCKLLNLEPAFFGAVSAVVNMQPSIFLTVKTAKDQILVHLIGVGFGLLFGYLVGGSPLTMGLVSILLIAVYIRMGLNSGISMGIVAAVFVMGSSQELFLPHALNRTGVIFAGLTTAMFVNVFLWPPRYSQRFKTKLSESNEAAVAYFCQALGEYVKLENEMPEMNPAEKEQAHLLNVEVRTLSVLLLREGEMPTVGTPKQSQWLMLAEKLIDYNEALTEKADRIYALLPARLERRHQAGDLPISEEFRGILSILGQGGASIQRINDKLRRSIVDGEEIPPEEISEVYWEKLTVAIEQWQPTHIGSYYVHALIEAAVTANEIKWAARQGKQLLQESAERFEL
jgi:uncharacterized membrane protein YccC